MLNTACFLITFNTSCSTYHFKCLGFSKITNGDVNGHRVTPPPPPVRQYSPMTQSTTNEKIKSTSIGM